MKNRLKEIRLQRHISLRQCTRDTGISLRTLKRYENGYMTVSVEYIILLADYYDVSVDEMFRQAGYRIGSNEFTKSNCN